MKIGSHFLRIKLERTRQFIGTRLRTIERPVWRISDGVVVVLKSFVKRSEIKKVDINDIFLSLKVSRVYQCQQIPNVRMLEIISKGI
jgi:hypothetical protein